MGLYDREYSQESYRSRARYSPQMRMSFRNLTPIVKKLLIINLVVFFFQILGANQFLIRWFTVYPVSLAEGLQFWRYITYQFLHGGLMHVLFNMLGLYFLGPVLEKHWGSKKFLFFYLGCGVVGGVFYPLLVAAKFLGVAPMLGASGAILGMLAACAILFPHFVVFIFLFPVPIRLAAIICIFISAVIILSRGENAGGEAAHLGGMMAGAIYVWTQPMIKKNRLKAKSETFEKKMNEQKNLQSEVDRILEKVHNSGIQSLTAAEKKTLKKATRAQQTRNRT